MRPFLGHMHTYGSAALKQDVDLVYYCSSQSVEITIIRATDLVKNRFQISVNRPMQTGHLFAEMMAISQYHTMVCLSVEVISI